MKKKHVRSKKGVMLLLFLISFHMIAFAQTVNVTGNVSDDNGEPLPGVNITVVGTFQGTITNIDGIYSIDVPADGQLTFNFIGFASQIIDVNNQSKIDIILSEDSENLEEVVVVGYGTMKKLDVSGSIVSTDAEVLQQIPAVSATQALQGRLPGIEMLQTSTRPGAAMQIRIRGERSLNATNDPLIVVDGIPFGGSMNDISPSDIKSLDILKDASATAIYGSRGSNGVILITTNRGRMNSKASVTYNGYYGIKSVSKKYPVFNGAEYQKFKHATLNETYKDGYTDLEKQMIVDEKDTDWQDLMYSTATVTNHDVAISTGTENGAYSFGAGYYDETSVLPGQEFQRYSLRVAVDQKIGKYVKVGLSSQNSYSITDGEDTNYMYNILGLSPLMPAYNEDGSVRNNPTEGHIDTYYNPLLLKDSKNWQEKRKRISLFNSLYGEVKISDHFKYRLNVGLSYSNENYGNFSGTDSPIKNGGISSATVQDRHYTSWTVENMLYYDRVFNGKHRVNATVMYSAEEREFSQSQMQADDITADYLLWNNLGLSDGAKTINADDQQYYKKGLLSYMARLMYSYDDRYSFTGTWRRDGASVLAPGHKWHSYVAFSGGWNINNESFMENVEGIDQLKLRLGYGETSNQAIDSYATLGQLSQLPYNFGSTGYYGANVSNLPNLELGWEYTRNYNLGLDFGFFNNRISGYLEMYFQKTRDLLYQVQLPQSSGVSGTVWQNIGATQNKGIEFALSAQIIQPKVKGNFSWDVDFNIYANRNEITALNSGVTKDIGNGFFVGKPINVVYDYKNIGIIGENDAPYLGNASYSAGKIKIADISGPDGVPDGEITEADRKILGNFQPDFAGGFSTRLAYKNFDMSIVSFFKSGGLLVSTIHMPQTYLSTNNGRRNSIKVDYWTPENTGGKYPQPGNQSSAEQNDWGSTLGYFNASFWKVRTITLGYTVDSEKLASIGCESARFYLTCQNPFTLFSPYMKAGGLDPEATGRGAQKADKSLSSGITDRALSIGSNTPSTRNFLIGVRVKF